MNIDAEENELNENVLKKQIYLMSLAYLIQTLVSIYKLYVAVLLYLDGQLGYFITYICFISIMKISALIRRIYLKYPFHYCFLGVFDLEFISILFTKTNKDIKDEQYMTIVFHFIPIQFLFFYCFGVLENSGINQYVIACQYLNYVIQTLNLVIVSFAHYMYIEYNILQKIFGVLTIKLFLYSYSCTIISLTFFQDNNGINLGYYCLALIPINQILLMIIYFFSGRILSLLKLQGMFFAVTFINFIVFNTSKLEYIIGSILSFLNSLVKFILLLKFGITHLDKFLEQEQNAFYGKIKFSVTIIALFYSLIYIVVQIFFALDFFIKQRNYMISNTQDFDNVNDKLMNNGRQIKMYRIFFLFNEQSFSDKQNNDTQITLFWKLISEQIKKKNIIQIKQKQGAQLKMNPNILIEVENIHSQLLSQLDEKIKMLWAIDHIIIKRLQNGIINKSTMKLVGRQNVRNKRLITKMISHTLQISSFYKHLSPLVMNNSASILYDLYGDLQIEQEQQIYQQKFKFFNFRTHRMLNLNDFI